MKVLEALRKNSCNFHENLINLVYKMLKCVNGKRLLRENSTNWKLKTLSGAKNTSIQSNDTQTKENDSQKLLMKQETSVMRQ